jgi:hypothetical protein
MLSSLTDQAAMTTVIATAAAPLKHLRFIHILQNERIRSRKLEREQPARQLNNDVLLSVVDVRHHAVLAVGREAYLSEARARALVDSEKIRNAIAALPRGKQQCGCRQQGSVSGSTNIRWNVRQSLDQWIVPDVVLYGFRGVAVWNHPKVFTCIQVDGGNPAYRSLPYGEAIDGLRHSGSRATSATSATSGATSGGRRSRNFRTRSRRRRATSATGCSNGSNDRSGTTFSVSATGRTTSHPIDNCLPGLSGIVTRGPRRQ